MIEGVESSLPQGEIALKTGDGQELPVYLHLNPLHLQGGVAYCMVVTDLTERKEREALAEAKRLLADSEARLRVTLSSIGDAVIATDTQGLITFLNPVAETLTGWRNDQVHGTPLEGIFKIVDERSRAPIESPIRGVLEKGKVVGLNNSTVLVHKDGTETPIDDCAAPIKDDQDQVRGVVVVFRDVTEPRRAEKAQRFLAETSSALVGSLHYPSILRRLSELVVPVLGDFCFFDVLAADDQIERFGEHRTSAAKKPSDRLGTAALPKHSLHHPIARLLEMGKSDFVPEVDDNWMRTNAANPEHLQFMRDLNFSSFMMIPLRVGERRLGALTFAHSHSKRHHTAADLELAEELARRTALVLENAKFYAELQEADHRKDEFLAMLAHELRNPLAPVRNAVQILRMKNADPATQEKAREVMDRQLQHLVRLVDDLLDVSRIMRSRIELRMERVELQKIVERAIETAQPLIDAQEHELIVDMPTAPIWLKADSVRLAQVIGNLLDNATKYTERSGRIAITVELEGETVVFRVKDNGIGIPPHLLTRLFDLFMQAERSLDRSQGGLGIGLTLVRRLVEMHGGSVEAHSPGIGKGSEFIVRLPQSLDTAAGPAAPDLTTGAPAIPMQRRVLVVDDNVDGAESVAMLLRLGGHVVEVVFDGRAALDSVRRFRPEIVLLDIGLPGMNGYEVARRVREQFDRSQMMLVAMTGYGQDEDRRRSQEAGFDAHLVKPIDLADLQQILATDVPSR